MSNLSIILQNPQDYVVGLFLITFIICIVLFLIFGRKR